MGTKKPTWPSRSGRGLRVGWGGHRGSKELRPPEVPSKTRDGNMPESSRAGDSSIHHSTVRTRRHAACHKTWNRGLSGEVVKENAQGVVTVAVIGPSIRPSWMELERHHGPDTMSRFFLVDPSGPVSLVVVVVWWRAITWQKLGGPRFHGFAALDAAENEVCKERPNFPVNQEGREGGGFCAPNLAIGHSFHTADQVRINKFLLTPRIPQLPSPT